MAPSMHSARRWFNASRTDRQVSPPFSKFCGIASMKAWIFSGVLRRLRIANSAFVRPRSSRLAKRFFLILSAASRRRSYFSSPWCRRVLPVIAEFLFALAAFDRFCLPGGFLVRGLLASRLRRALVLRRLLVRGFG